MGQSAVDRESLGLAFRRLIFSGGLGGFAAVIFAPPSRIVFVGSAFETGSILP